MKKEKPYIEEIITTTIYKYNKNYGDDRLCECGHSYYRHFDSYEDMDACGCKYCQCFNFKEIKVGTKLNIYIIFPKDHKLGSPVEKVNIDTKITKLENNKPFILLDGKEVELTSKIGFNIKT